MFKIYTFFKMIKSVADLDKTNYSIKDLTIRLALSAGYYRDSYTFKNGHVRDRTRYSGEFDNILTAKWFMYFKKLFIAKLSKHPEFADYHCQIISRTFQIVMTSINLEKIIDDDIVHRYVNMSLANRIGEVLYAIGSPKRLEDYFNNGVKYKVKLNTAMNRISTPLEQTTVKSLAAPPGLNDSDIIIDLHSRLSHTKYGLKLLDCLLHSNRKVSLNSVNILLDLDDSECNKESKKDILNSYNIIKNTLYEYLECDHDKFDWDKSIRVSYRRGDSI